MGILLSGTARAKAEDDLQTPTWRNYILPRIKMQKCNRRLNIHLLASFRSFYQTIYWLQIHRPPPPSIAQALVPELDTSPGVNLGLPC